MKDSGYTGGCAPLNALLLVIFLLVILGAYFFFKSF